MNHTASNDLDDAELAGLVRNLFYRARAHKRPIVSLWNRCYRILRNRTWAQGRPAWLPSPEVPEIYPIVASLVGWITDQRPQFDCVPAAELNSPYHEFYSQLSHDLSTVLLSISHVNEYEREIENVVWDSLLYGTGVFKTGWDLSLSGGLGDAVLRRVDPFTWYPDPAATSFHDMNYCIEARTMSLQEMDRRWPGSAKRFTAGISEDIDMAPTMVDGPTGIARANPGAIAPNTRGSFGLPGQGRSWGQATDDHGVTVFECWMRQHRTWKDEDGESHVYDHWRVVVVAGNIVLMDENAEDLWSHAGHPYTSFVPHQTGEMWGMSLVDMLAPSQLSINRLLASIQQNIELTGNPVFKESTRSGLQRTKITNKPGTRVTVNENSTADWLQPPPIHEAMPMLIQFYIGEMERISGLSSMIRGASPTGRNAQGVLDAVQEAAFVRIRMSLRNLEYSLRTCFEQLASLVVENYTTPRLVAIVGPSMEKSSLALKPRHFHVPTAEGAVPMRFQLLVNAGSALSTSRQKRVEEAITLYTLGAIDDQALLEATDFPNRNVVAQRVMQMKAAGVLQPPGQRQRAKRTS